MGVGAVCLGLAPITAKDGHVKRNWNRTLQRESLGSIAPFGIMDVDLCIGSFAMFYVQFLLLPYLIITVVAADIGWRRCDKSLTRHISDISEGIVYTFVIYILGQFWKTKYLVYFALGTVTSLLGFCVASSYGPYRDFQLASTGCSGSSMPYFLLLLILAIICAIRSCEKLCLPLGVPALIGLLNWYACPNYARIHLHHWLLFFTLGVSISILYMHRSTENSRFLSGLCYGAFLHGIALFGFDPFVEKGSRGLLSLAERPKL